MIYSVKTEIKAAAIIPYNGIMPQLSSRDKDEVRPNELAKVIENEPQEKGLENIPVTPGNYRKFKGADRHGLPKGILWGIFGLVVIFIGGSLMSLYVFRGKVAGSVAANITTLRTGVADLQNLDPQAAQQKFSSLQDLSASDIGSLMSGLGFLFSGGKDVVASFSDLSKQLVLLSQELGTMESSSFDFLVNGRGATLISELQNLRETVGAIDAASNKLSGAASFAGGLSSGTFTSRLRPRLRAQRSSLTFSCRGSRIPVRTTCWYSSKTLRRSVPPGDFSGAMPTSRSPMGILKMSPCTTSPMRIRHSQKRSFRQNRFRRS